MFYFIVSLTIIQRLIELVIARRNEKIMLAKGAFEAGNAHYPYLVAMHVCFFGSLILEVYAGQLQPSPFVKVIFILFIIVQAIRIWCLLSLKTFWNTKIIVLPGASIVKKGPYRYIKHPNYIVVTLEIILLPFMFQAYITAIIFTVLNLVLLAIRIPIEEKALYVSTND